MPELLALNCQVHYYQRLKALFAAFCFASTFLAAGCGDPSEKKKPLPNEAGEKTKPSATLHGTPGSADLPGEPGMLQSAPDAPLSNKP